MPFKDQKTKKQYKHDWYLRKKSGLETKTKVAKTPEERKEDQKRIKREYNRQRKSERKKTIRKKFGENCSICGDDYHLQIHEIYGQEHKSPHQMTQTEFEIFLESDDFAQLCYNCHKIVHWCLKYLGLTWDEIQSRKLKEFKGKNIYHP